jgi:ABC-type dipeptide/oligopeptide/nickel transport system permease subunit
MLKEIMIFVFCPSRFIKIASYNDLPEEIKTSLRLQETFPGIQVQIGLDRQKDLEESALQSASRIRHSFKIGFGLALLTLIGGYGLGILLGYLLGPARRIIIALLQSFAALIILGATLSLAGWEIQTFGGKTLSEKVNRWLYQISYVIGTGILVASLTWPQ